MRSERRNYQKEALERYLRLKPVGEFNRENFYKSGFELLSLLFAYVRKQNGVHLRWNRSEANRLALVTVGQLKAKKKTDPILNQVYDMIMELAGNNKALVDQLLNLAEIRIDEISRSQSKKARTLRMLNPAYKLILGYLKINNELTASEIISKLEDEKGMGVITDYDEERIYYSNPDRVTDSPSITKRTIKNVVSQLKNNKRKFKQIT